MRRPHLLSLVLPLALAAPLRAAEGALPPGLSVLYQNGKLSVSANNVPVRQILQDVATKAGFKLEGVDLLPDDRVIVQSQAKVLRKQLPDLLALAPKVNYVLVLQDLDNPRSGIVRVSLFPREGGKGGFINVGSGSPGGSMNAPPPPSPPPFQPPPMPDSTRGQPPAPVYVPPETPPVYIPPESPPVYIPPDSPPQYIPADGPPQYIPPAPANPGEPPPPPLPPRDPNGSPPGQ